MGSVKSYRDLLIWQKGMALVRRTYEITNAFPDAEKFGLISQIRRSAVSIPSNIAEGQARQHTKEFRQFLFIALGSLAEFDTQLELSRQLNYLSSTEYNEINVLIVELQKMIHGLIKKLPRS